MAVKLGNTTASLYLGSTPVAAYLGATQVYSATTPAALLLNFNGENESNTFTDSSANAFTVTANGDAQISTAQSKFGGASGYFDGAGDYLSIEADPALPAWHDEDWTVELWIRPGGSGYRPVVTQDGRFNLHLLNTTDLYVNNAIDGAGGIVATSAVELNAWQHVAVVRQSGVTKVYVGGTEIASASVPYGNSGSNDLTIAGAPDDFYTGYIDDLRIVKGKAVYTAAFTPPAAQLGPNA
jgi:hypothetical protein